MSVEITDLSESIVLITMSGKTATQSFSMEFLPQIADSINQALSNPKIKAIVLTGEGKVFLRRADINSFAKSIEKTMRLN